MELKDVPMVIRQMYGEQICELTKEPKWENPGKLGITAAITGAFFKRDQNPNQPYSPDELVREAISSIEAGASSVHIHVRDPISGDPSSELEFYQEVCEGIKEKYPDIILDGCLTRGNRFDETLRPAKFFNVTPINPTATYIGDTLLAFNPIWVKEKIRYCQQNNIKIQIAIYDTGDINNIERWAIRDGLLEKPYYWILLPGLPGCGSISSPFQAMELISFMVRRIKEIDEESVFVVCSAGRAARYSALVSIMLGGHVRVGMEDTIFKFPFSDEKIKSNAEEVHEICQLSKLLGREIATPEEYRQMIGI